ncbi:hypothetical protein M3667_07555 [Microbacterium sp. P26]|uniref:hypothetical protein n=1 Tax=Microbacterium TaxID=33882 RepID=UPI00203C20DA|nr:hypothetical protein [Microbacterium sp. P26]MCM3501733.1 hypothetical protein [Microbacterium sp. P26]
MSTSENPETPPLTRRQLRELRQTGATPIIVPQSEGESPDAAAAEPAAPTTPIDEASSPHEVIDAVPEGDQPAAPASAEEAPVDEAPSDEPSTDEAPSEEAPSVEAASDNASPDAADEPAPAVAALDERPAAAAFPPAFGSPFSDESAEFGVSGLTRRQVREQEKIRTAAVPIISSDLERSQPAPPAPAPRADDAPVLPAIFRPSAPETDETAVSEPQGAASVVNPALGSDLLEGVTPDVTLPASFDQLITRGPGGTGAVSTPNALILSQTPTGVPLVGPMTGTGEIMITGSFDLPAGLGSVGHAPGTTDGHDADAVLLDGELPPASSPTPIAASAAISTVKQPGEIIRPPAPEKGSKLLLVLVVTTGILALGVVVALGLAITTGVFR